MTTEAMFQARVGQIIGAKYRLHRLIGTGGMGAVYEAENTWIKRRVAIKVLRPDLTRNQEALQRFTQEAQAATQIEHPNIVYVLDMGQEPSDGSLYIVQEFLTGIDLRRRLEHDRVLSLQEAIATIVPIMNALVAAHERGIVHRDLKPENIFLARNLAGEIVPKVIDFGVSKIMDTSGSLTRTQAGASLGTPYYMSPEQGRGDLDLDARSDVWAIGVLLFEVLSGRPPFDAANHHLLVLKILTERAPRLDAIAPHVPAEFASLVAAALEPDRERRIPTMRAFRESLGSFAANHPELGAVPDTSTPSPGAMVKIATARSEAPPSRTSAPSTAILGSLGPLPPMASEPARSNATEAFGVTVAQSPSLPVAHPNAPAMPPREPTIPLDAMPSPPAPVQSPTPPRAAAGPPALQATSLGWVSSAPAPQAPPARTPWLLFMAIAALSVFIGAAGVALLKKRHRLHVTLAAHAPPVTRLATATQPPTPVTDAGAITAPVPPHDDSQRQVPAPIEPAPAPLDAPRAMPAPRRGSRAARTHAATAHAPAPPSPPIAQPRPVAQQPAIPPTTPQPAQPAPRRVQPAAGDALVQQGSSVASQLQYASQQLAYSDPGRAQRLAEDAARLQYETDQIRAMETQVRELQSVDPGTAQQLRAATDRQRVRLQRMIERFTHD